MSKSGEDSRRSQVLVGNRWFLNLRDEDHVAKNMRFPDSVRVLEDHQHYLVAETHDGRKVIVPWAAILHLCTHHTTND